LNLDLESRQADCGTLARALRNAAYALLAIGLVACAVPGNTPIVPSALKISTLITKDGTAVVAVPEPSTRITALPTVPEVLPSAQTLARDKQGAIAIAALPTEPVSINLEQVTLGTFAQLIFSDLLKKNVNVDAPVLARKDLVTFRSGASQAPAALETAAKLLLKSYGVAVIDVGGLVRVVLDTAAQGNLPEMRRVSSLPDTPLPLRPVFHVVDLLSVQPAQVVGWVKMMFGDRVRIQEDLGRNALLLSGTPDNLQAALEAISFLDQPVLRGGKSLSISPLYWSAEDLARRLSDVLTAEGYSVQSMGGGGIRHPIVIMPVPAINAVYVFAQSGAVIDHITQWARTLDVPSDRGVGKTFFTYAVKHKDATLLAKTLEQLLGRSGAPAAAGAATIASTVVVDASTNTLIFQTSREEYSKVSGLLQTLDRPAKGALIEVTVAELSLDDKNQLGVEWLTNKALSGGGSVSAGTAGGLAIGSAGFNYRVFDGATNLRFVLNALASDNQATVLSSPRVMARNGETATIQVGQEVPIITSQQSGGTTTAGTPAVLQTIQYRSTGVILKVRPVIHSSDQIDLEVSQEVSGAQSTSTGVNVSPTFTTRRIDTKLTLRNGATVLLGGLISDQNSQGMAGIPFLKDVPGLGSFFSTKNRSGQRSELVMLITPYVINDNSDAEAVTTAFRNMLGPWAATMQPASVDRPQTDDKRRPPAEVVEKNGKATPAPAPAAEASSTSAPPAAPALPAPTQPPAKP
jgi:general secretion pathway protein D